jgi:hypothetical protein
MLRYSEASAFLVIKRRSFASTLRMTTLGSSEVTDFLNTLSA